MVRLRIAPAPSGDLQLGNIRTALVNYAFVTQNKGEFILRIDDTNQKKSTQESLEKIIKTFDWLGIKFNEGPNMGGKFGPYIQSERTSLYDKYFKKLQDEGKIYECICPKRSEKKNNQEETDCKCDSIILHKKKEIISKLNGKISYRVKIKDEAPSEFKDLIMGKQKINPSKLKNPIIKRSDGTYTYIFANCVDDYLMKITHIMRGSDLFPSTSSQVLLTNLLGGQIPIYAHLPLLLNIDGSKLSKSVGSQSINNLKEGGYINSAILAYLLTIGEGDYKKFVLDNPKNLLENYPIKKLGKTNQKFDPERLKWFNKQRIKKLSTQELYDLSYPLLKKEHFKEPISLEILALHKDKINTLKDLNNLLKPYIPKETGNYQLEYSSQANDQISKNILNSLIKKIKKIKKIDSFEFNKSLNELEKELNLKEKEGKFKIYSTIRLSLTGSMHGLEIYDIYNLIGKEEFIRRIEKFKN